MSSAAEQSEDDANREDASFFTFEFVANDEGGIELEQRPRNELDATPLAPNESVSSHWPKVFDVKNRFSEK